MSRTVRTPVPAGAAFGHESVVQGGTGAAFRLAAGALARITNPHGSQVVDTWALLAASPTEHLSMDHTRTVLGRVSPRVGDTLYTNRRRPILTLEQDSSPGGHDTLIAACDPARYRMLGHLGYHRSCHENFVDTTRELGIEVDTPAPLNLFMNIPIGTDGALSFEPSTCRPGDQVTLAAHEDLYLVVSACPQDLVPINGQRLTPADVSVAVASPR